MGKDYSKNHIVPKRYLDRFADKGRSQYMIGTRIIEQGKVRFFMQATENVGYEKDIYDIGANVARRSDDGTTAHKSERCRGHT